MTGWPSITSVPLYFTGGPGGAFKGYVYRKHRHVFFEKCRRSCLVTNSLSLISEEETAAGGGARVHVRRVKVPTPARQSEFLPKVITFT